MEATPVVVIVGGQRFETEVAANAEAELTVKVGAEEISISGKVAGVSVKFKAPRPEPR